jgi:hypothetical protein
MTPALPATGRPFYPVSPSFSLFLGFSHPFMVHLDQKRRLALVVFFKSVYIDAVSWELSIWHVWLIDMLIANVVPSHLGSSVKARSISYLYQFNLTIYAALMSAFVKVCMGGVWPRNLTVCFLRYANPIGLPHSRNN